MGGVAFGHAIGVTSQLVVLNYNQAFQESNQTFSQNTYYLLNLKWSI